MKKNKIILLLTLALFVFASCNDDEDNNDNKKPREETHFDFVGRVVASNGYVQDSVKSNFYKVDSTNSYTIFLNEVTFSDKMPFVNFELRDLKPQIVENDTIILMDTLVPYWNNAPFVSMTLYNFKATITSDSLIFTSTGGEDTEEGSVSLSYSAKRIK